ncbi:MAG: hypothetical protein KGL68_10580 [Burkholderiales bacterium]|nr:hypothetical protein [Burkholderiales bacterium]
MQFPSPAFPRRPSYRAVAAAAALVLACHAAGAAQTGPVSPQARAQAAYAAADAAYQAYAAGAYADAADHAARATNLVPRRRDYWLLLARAQMALGRLHAASLALDAAERARGDDAALAKLQDELTQARAREAAGAMYAALAAGELPRAVDSGTLAVRLAPADPAYRLVLVHTLLRQRRFAEAQGFAAEGLAQRPGDGALWALSAQALHALGKDDEASGAAARALQQPAPEALLRQQRLLAADLALAQGRPGGIGELVEPMGAQDAAAQSRRDWAAQEFARPQGPRPALPLPAIDCSGVQSQGTCMLQAGALQALPGHADATAAYAAMDRKDYGAALRHARLATEASPGQRAWWRLHLQAAIGAGERDEAEAIAARPELAAQDRLQLAYLSLRAGDDPAGLRTFASLEAQGELPPPATLDAAYAAVRAGRDEEALAYFDQAVAYANEGRLPLDPQRLYETKREAADVSRKWGVLASVTSRNAAGIEPVFGAIGSGGNQRTTQGGTEAYWRPWGYGGGRYVEVFARGFATLAADAPGAWTGGDSFQGGIGARWKPLAEHDLVLSGSRIFGPNVRDAWLLQAGYSLEKGTELRLDVPSWWTTRNYVEAGKYLGEGQHAWYAVASLTAGRSWRVGGDERTAIYPHLYLGAEHRSDDPVARTSSGVGAGVTVRQWFREGATRGPHSWWEVTLQYRHGTSGDKRLDGPYLGVALSF